LYASLPWQQQLLMTKWQQVRRIKGLCDDWDTQLFETVKSQALRGQSSTGSSMV
jgi:hypothetical protein